VARERRGVRPWEIRLSATAGRRIPGRRLLLAAGGLAALVGVLFVWHLIQAQSAMIADDLPLMEVVAESSVEFSAVTNRLTYRRSEDPAGHLAYLADAGAQRALRASAVESFDLYAMLVPYRIEVVGD